MISCILAEGHEKHDLKKKVCPNKFFIFIFFYFTVYTLLYTGKKTWIMFISFFWEWLFLGLHLIFYVLFYFSFNLKTEILILLFVLLNNNNTGAKTP